MLKRTLENVRQRRPLVHNITNYVTANDCANILLACGGSPIMADEPAEAEEITSACDGLNINMGTLSQRTIPSMLSAGKRANELGHPVLLDPVGVGASSFRAETAARLMEEVHFSVIRANLSEHKALAFGCGTAKGVDAEESDAVTKGNLEEMVSFAKRLAVKMKAIIIITGAVDIVADTEKAYCIYNGHPMMRNVTGTGCQLSALVTAFVAANPDSLLEAAVGAVCTMGVCGELAYERLGEGEGNATYRNYLIDAVSLIDGDTLERLARYKRV